MVKADERRLTLSFFDKALSYYACPLDTVFIQHNHKISP